MKEMSTVFPKVTICNSAFATSEYAYKLIKEINDLYYPNVSIFNQTQMSQLSFDEMQSLVEIFNLYNTHINLNTFTDDLRQKLVHPFEDVLWYCEFNGRECTVERDFVWRWDLRIPDPFETYVHIMTFSMLEFYDLYSLKSMVN